MTVNVCVEFAGTALMRGILGAGLAPGPLIVGALLDLQAQAGERVQVHGRAAGQQRHHAAAKLAFAFVACRQLRMPGLQAAPFVAQGRQR